MSRITGALEVINVMYYRCSSPCTSVCKENKKLVCSRCYEEKEVECHEVSHRQRSYSSSGLNYSFQCDTPCDETLACGHTCSGTCYSWLVFFSPILTDCFLFCCLLTNYPFSEDC